MTALLAIWTEKLAGGPHAGTSDSPPLARVMGVGRQQQGRERGKEGKSNEAERSDNTEREATGVNSMATEKRSLAVVWKNVRKMRSRERHSEIMDWINRSNCDICIVNETGLTGEEYMEVVMVIHGLLQIEHGLKGGLVVQVSSLKMGFDVRNMATNLELCLGWVE